MKLRKCRECKQKKSLDQFSLDRGQPRRLCKPCASTTQSVRYRGQGSEGRKRILKNWNAHFERDPARARFILSKSAAKQAGHTWTISLEAFRAINSNPCYYCGGPLPPKGRGLDRIDHSKGYSFDNVLPCCSNCNAMRGNFLTVEEMKAAIKAVKALRIKTVGINPKDLVGATKPPLDLFPMSAIVHGSRAMGNGAVKYGPWNWRDVDNKVQARTYVAAALRHLYCWLDGEEAAEDSGVHHLGHAMACCAILLDAQENGFLADNRPAAGNTAALIKKFTTKK